jgi:uncharacterized surface protein with fasciclin (FAS1) repeats
MVRTRQGAHTSVKRIPHAVLPVALALSAALTACTSDDGSSSASGSSSSSAASSSAASTTSAASDQPFGAGCAQIPAESFAGMATAPVATAAASNPVLTMLVQTVTAANLVDSLNSQQDVTVLAPADAAFQAVPADTLNAAVADVPS